MKPDYKRAAHKYLEMYRAEQERISCFIQAENCYKREIKNLRQELSEWKGKYSNAMDKIIQLQEELVRVTKGADTNDT